MRTTWCPRAPREGVRYAVVRRRHERARGNHGGRHGLRSEQNRRDTGCVTATWNPDHQPGSTVAVTVTNAFAPIAPFPFVSEEHQPHQHFEHGDLPLSTCGIAPSSSSRRTPFHNAIRYADFAKSASSSAWLGSRLILRTHRSSSWPTTTRACLGRSGSDREAPHPGTHPWSGRARGPL